jgi:hypothetical protein
MQGDQDGHERYSPDGLTPDAKRFGGVRLRMPRRLPKKPPS